MCLTCDFVGLGDLGRPATVDLEIKPPALSKHRELDPELFG